MNLHYLWLGLGWVSMAAAAVGIALPVMPTVPFLLVAAWAFTKSSPALRDRLRSDPRYGKTIRDWQDRGVVPRLAKLWGISAMAFGVGLSAVVGMPGWVIACQATICACVAVFLITRPER